MENMKVVILCGGKGTRSYPFTEYFPKVMMPVNVVVRRWAAGWKVVGGASAV